MTDQEQTNPQEITPIEPLQFDTKSELLKQHEKLIATLNEQIRNTTPINAAQFITYNPISGVYMPFTEQERIDAQNRIANTAPSIISLLFRRHWVTSVFGIIAIVPQILVVSGLDLGVWSGVISTIAGGFGLIFAQSATVKS